MIAGVNLSVFLLFIGLITSFNVLAQALSPIAESPVTLSKQPNKLNPTIDYQHVKPILEKRCIVCHGCYDAPCQLKLSSYAGVARGASDIKVYDGERIRAIEPTRLFFDAQTRQEWQQKGFFSVIEKGLASENNAEESVLYKMLALKEQHPQPTSGRLPKSYTLGLNREDKCPTPKEFDAFATNHPNWGMPYALPNLPKKEYQQLLAWAKQGAPGEVEALETPKLSKLAKRYEAYLNQPELKQQLMARYVYEHLFLGHLHFAGDSARTFYQLVRSNSPPSQPIQLIVSDRPYDQPTYQGKPVERVYYRLRPISWSLVDKDHLVYSIDRGTIANYQQWFINPDYEVDLLPNYDPFDSTNPFKIFADIPAEGRYKFMLDQAHFIIGSYIKGPVCRGQVALNVIEEQFWVMFFDPDKDRISSDTEFLAGQSYNLSLPSENGVNTYSLLAAYTKYQNKQRLYLDAKQAHLKKFKGQAIAHDFDLIWQGGAKTNPNAFLTVFRDGDSATVVKGLQGKIPKTAWLIDYPLLERIQYLLVSGFDVYGNIGHQLNTRLYMDFLRMEGENNFLSFLPEEEREAKRNFWYRNTPEEMIQTELEPTQTDIEYTSDNVMVEFFTKLTGLPSLQASLDQDQINRPKGKKQDHTHTSKTTAFLQKLANLKGEAVNGWPDVSFLKVNDKRGGSQYYSLFLNKGYYSVTSLLFDKYSRVPEENTVTVVSGLVGSYPNMFFEVNEADFDAFLNLAAKAEKPAQVTQWVKAFGVRRTSPDFWHFLDDMHFSHQQQNPITWGWFDLNRYRND